jgi:DNA-binding NarL/FixJ family response regulator
MPTTVRQVQVLAGAARGDGYAQIGTRLHMSPDMAKRALHRAAGELDVGPCINRVPAAVDAAYRTGLLTGLPHEPREFAPLPAKRRRVLELIAQGLTDRQIGAALGVSEDTIGTHAKLLYRDLGARTRAHAVALGHQLGHLTTTVGAQHAH